MNLMNSAENAIELRGVSKKYGTLRPLRISHFALRQTQTVALLGFDRAAAEVLVNLITAATLPDAGEVEVFGSPTSHLADFNAWFRLLDRFGIVSERVALIDELTVEQNLALPLSLEVDGMAPELRSRVGKIADVVGIEATERMQSMRGAEASLRMRVRLGTARALEKVLELRGLLHEVLSAAANGRRADAARLRSFNEALAEAVGHLQVQADRGAFGWSWTGDEADLERPLWPVVRAAADLLTSEELPLVKDCANDQCGWLFVDRSRRGNRRWCEMRECGNRAKARRYYQRARATRTS